MSATTGIPTIEAMAHCIASGRSLKDAFPQSTDRDWEALYSQAYAKYSYGCYSQAEPLFRLLCLACPLDERHYLGLGVVLKEQRRYQEALETFDRAQRLGCCDPWLSLHAAECRLRLRHYSAALADLEKTLDRIGGRPDAERIFTRLKLLFERVERESSRFASTAN